MRHGGSLSVRVQLTFWYSAVLGLGLFIFGIAIWLLLEQALFQALQRELSLRTNSLRSFITDEVKEPGVHLVEELQEYCHGLPHGTYFWLSDERGEKVFASDPAFDLPPDFGSARTYVLSQDSVRAGDATYRINGALSASEVLFTLRELRVLLVTLTPAVLLLASLGGYLLSRRALRPVDRITEAARLLSIRDLSGRLPVPSTGDELQRLSQTWNSMLDRLQDAVERLSRFTQDASHELRTPLAIIRSTAEIASRRSRSEDAYRRALQEIVQESDRLTGLIEDLLLLARGEQTETLPLRDVCLARLITNVCRSVTPLAAQRNIQLKIEIPTGPLVVSGDEFLLRRLLIVLLDNALKYSPDGSSVAVKLDEANGVAEMQVSDAGIGIEASDLDRIFERFYRGEAAREAWTGGSGLGLSLAVSIARKHKATITVSSEPGRGSVFTVAFA